MHEPIDRRVSRRTVALAAGLVVLAMVSVTVALRHTTKGPAPALDPAPIGRPAPEFSVPLLNGGTLSLRSLRGKPVVLNFWASWCAPCREETPLLVRLHKLYGPRGVQFVGLNAEDQAAGARAFVAQHHVDYLVGRLEDERIIDAYAVPGLPTTIFIDAGGTVVGKVVGGFVGPQGEHLLISRLDRLLSDSHH